MCLSCTTMTLPSACLAAGTLIADLSLTHWLALALTGTLDPLTGLALAAKGGCN